MYSLTATLEKSKIELGFSTSKRWITGAFFETKVLFLPAGHTHEDNYQPFSVASERFKSEAAITLNDFRGVIGMAYGDIAPIT